MGIGQPFDSQNGARGEQLPICAACLGVFRVIYWWLTLAVTHTQGVGL